MWKVEITNICSTITIPFKSFTDAHDLFVKVTHSCDSTLVVKLVYNAKEMNCD